MSTRPIVEAQVVRRLGQTTICTDIAECHRLAVQVIRLRRLLSERTERMQRLRAKIMVAITSPFKNDFVEFRGR